MKKYYTKSKKKRNILQTIIRRRANWTGHILCRNCLLECIIEGTIKLTGKQGRRCQQLLDGLQKRRRYLKFKEAALDHLVWRTHFWRGYGPVVILIKLLCTSIVDELQSNYLKKYIHYIMQNSHSELCNSQLISTLVTWIISSTKTATVLTLR